MNRKVIQKAMLLVSLVVLLSACRKNNYNLVAENTPNTTPNITQTPPIIEKGVTDDKGKNEDLPIIINDKDYSLYFNGFSGSAVFFSPTKNTYNIFNSDLAQKRYSPCSTFKIISSIVGLENGVINPNNSTRKWNGETFWNSGWNRDIDFNDAFKTSCVWYFREVADDIGKELMQESLNNLSYGNVDISNWEGQISHNRKLSGFWLESSLKISPKEQTEVLAKIFEEPNEFNMNNLALLKTVMMVEQDNPDYVIYGKTGTGMFNNKLLDAWFVGFFTKGDENTYFAIHLGETDNPKASSALAKEIAIKIITECY